MTGSDRPTVTTVPTAAVAAAAAASVPDWPGFLDGDPAWTEVRPGEGGRGALLRRHADGRVEDVLGTGWDVRSRVHEYGGRPWATLPGSGPPGAAEIVFSHAGDGRVYRWAAGDAVPLSPRPAAGTAVRYCDFAPRDGEVWCLRERLAPGRAPDRRLVALPLDGAAARDPGAERDLLATHRFLTGPRLHPDGRRVAWIGWDHPDLPWDTTDLMVAEIDPAGRPLAPTRVAGGGVSVCQVEWGADGALHAVMDPRGWWNLHRLEPHGRWQPVLPVEEEFGDALWRVGIRWVTPLDDGRFAVLHGAGPRRLGLLSPDGTLRDVGGGQTDWLSLAGEGRRISAIAADPAGGRTVVLVEAGPTPGDSGLMPVDSGLMPGDSGLMPGDSGLMPSATPMPVAVPVRPPSPALVGGPPPVLRGFPGPSGETVYAHLHPPRPTGRSGPAPYLVHVHGGPTSRSPFAAGPETAFFTSRGIGVLDVQYGGSTGYGRAYRQRLRHRWGLTDVQDCAVAVRGLVEAGLADPERLAIRGASAGGWTALASLVAEPGLYRAATAYYPVLDAAAWRAATHDFESCYADTLIGPWPDSRDDYRDRSPTTAAARIKAPFLLLQGLDDRICPPELAAPLLARAGGEHRHLTFAGEGHGFRRQATVETCLQAELELYTRAFGTAPPR